MSAIGQIESAVEQIRRAAQELRVLRDREPTGSWLWQALDAIEDRLHEAHTQLETP